jgi:MFS family permease
VKGVTDLTGDPGSSDPATSDPGTGGAGKRRPVQGGGSPLRPFRHRAYRVFWTGAFISNIGTWIETVAVGTYVTEETGRAGWTGTIAALTFLPTVVLGPVAGAFADRVERRRYLALVTLVQTLLAVVLTVLAATGSLSVPATATIVFLSGCALACLLPAWSAALPDLVPPEDVLAASSLSQAQFNLGRVIGPAIAGVLLAGAGLAGAFGVRAVSFVAVLVALALIRLPRPEPADGRRERLRDQVRGGIDFARRDLGVRTALLLLAVTSVLVSPFIGLVPAVAVKVFGAGASATSTLVTAQGIGAVLAAVSAGSLAARFGTGRVLTGAVLAVGPVAAFYGLSPTLGLGGGASEGAFRLTVAALACLGFVYLLVLSGTSAVVQLRTPRPYRARLASLFMVVLGAGYPLGLVVHGWLGDRFGLPVVTAVFGMALPLVVLSARIAAPGWFAGMTPPAEGGPNAAAIEPATALEAGAGGGAS